MSKFFDDTMVGLLEAVAIEKGEIQVEQVGDFSSPTYRAENYNEE